MVERTISGNSQYKSISMHVYKLLSLFSPKLNLILYKMMVFVVQEPFVTTGWVCYPGSEIPEWLSFQSMGSSVTLELTPGWFNKNFFGFALCAIVPEYHGYTPGLHFRCNLKANETTRPALPQGESI